VPDSIFDELAPSDRRSISDQLHLPSSSTFDNAYLLYQSIDTINTNLEPGPISKHPFF
jgi:hypothetical protein